MTSRFTNCGPVKEENFLEMKHTWFLKHGFDHLLNQDMGCAWLMEVNVQSHSAAKTYHQSDNNKWLPTGSITTSH